MEIGFANSKFAKSCNNERLLVRRYGKRRATLIMRRLTQLRAAPTLDTFHPPYTGATRCHELTGSRKGVFSIDLDHPYRLLFEPAHDPIPTRPEGGIDWAHVTAIQIIGVEDTHD